MSDLHQRFEEEDELLRREAIRAMANHRATRKFLWWLLQKGKSLGHNPFSTDSLIMAHECGEMAIGQAILAAVIEADPEILIALMREMTDERNARDAQHRDAAAAEAERERSGYD